MREEIIKEILQEYDQMRLNRKKELSAREQQVTQKIPQIAYIRSEIIDLIAKRARDTIRGTENSLSTIQELQKRIAQLKAQQEHLLKENGFDSDYLSPSPVCPLCEDTGYVGELVKERCSCFKQKLLARTYQMSNGRDLKMQNFQTFDPNVFPDTRAENSKLTQREYMVQLRDRLLQYADEFPHQTRRMLLFTGRTGLGKTFLLNCLAKAITDKGYTVLQTTAYRLFEQLFRSTLRDQENSAYLLKHLFDVDVLIIDDLGTETQRNNFTVESFFNILNERCLSHRHTFLSTNLGLSELRERYSERITSRLFDTSNTILVKFFGQDIRVISKP